MLFYFCGGENDESNKSSFGDLFYLSCVNYNYSPMEGESSYSSGNSAYQFNLGARYALSKNTTAFANYTYLKSGVDSRVSTTATGVGAAGEKANVLSVSLRTDF